jgi:1,2-diacylglycerol 3-beta-glucosyltransferase
VRVITATASQLLLAIAIPYFLISVALGVRVARRGGGLRAHETGVATAATSGSNYHLYFLVPCLDEELVVAATVNNLFADEECRVVVIDDGSDDATYYEACRGAAAAGALDRLLLVRRRRPHARHGKGEALNAGFDKLVADVERRGLDPATVVVGVMDADGRLSTGGARAPLAAFDDPRIGGLQLAVRIRDRRRLICRFQDVEFWMISAISQFARSMSGTVSLGGNGQFTRLTALTSLSGRPWSRSLTEDLDLGVRLATAGWRTTTTAAAYVDQQGVGNYRRLLRQRTRWYQGHMMCVRRLPAMWASDEVRQVALIELSSYLLVPWLIVLPWSVIQQWVLYDLVAGSGRGVFATGVGSLPWQVVYAALWYLVSFLPNLAIGVVYSRRTRAVSLGQSLLLSHLMIVWNYVGYVAAWRAVVRIVLGRSGWEKTARNREVLVTGRAALAGR